MGDVLSVGVISVSVGSAAPVVNADCAPPVSWLAKHFKAYSEAESLLIADVNLNADTLIMRNLEVVVVGLFLRGWHRHEYKPASAPPLLVSIMTPLVFTVKRLVLRRVAGRRVWRRG